MNSPYPPYVESILKWHPLTEKYKGEEFNIIEYFWQDSVTGKTFDTVDTGQATIMQIYNAYRVKHGLPFIDELVKLRQLLNLSAAKMSAILGLGANPYRLYERGDMPVYAVGRYIKMLIDNKSALKECIEKNKSLLSPNEYTHAIEVIEKNSVGENTRNLLKSRNKDNGYAPLDERPLQNMVIYFLSELTHKLKTCGLPTSQSGI